MKLNLPNVDIEIAVPPDEVLVSRTDRRGIITYVNGVFAEISGFTLSELIGAPHNIVRHSDVPPAVFQDLWNTLKRGEPWQGVVKNRSKSGRYYWVDALVTPTFHGNKIIGYASVRRRPTAEQIETASRQYAAIRAGQPVRSWLERTGLCTHLSIRNGIILSILVVLITFLLGTAYSMANLKNAQQDYETMYRQQVEGADTLRRIKFLMGENRSQVLLALLHDPRNPISRQHDHPLDVHLQGIIQRQGEIDALWNNFKTVPMNRSVGDLADSYWRSRIDYVDTGLTPAIEALSIRADYEEAHRIMVGALQQSYVQANAKVDNLIHHMQQVAEQRQSVIRTGHTNSQQRMYLAIALVTLLLSIGGVLFFRAIMGPLEKSIDALTSVARGNLSRQPALQGLGETRSLMQAVAISQSQLHAILDQLAQNSTTLSGESTLLNYLVRHIADGTDEQHERVYQITDKLAESATAMAALSKQAEDLTGNAAQARTTLEIAEQDITDSLNRIHGVTDTVQQLREQAATIITRCQIGLESPASTSPDSPGQGQDLVNGIRHNLQRMSACLTDMSETIEIEKPTLMGLDAISSNSWIRLREISDTLGEMSLNLAIATRMQFFASEDIHADMRMIADFLVNNRGASHEIWRVSGQVMDLANSLEELTGHFTFSGEDDAKPA
jgi:aerotaxis receptor